MKIINKNSKIFLAGHKGLVGSAVLKLLKKKGYKKIIYRDRSDLDLINQKQTSAFFKKNKPECVIVCAAVVGGIKANINYQANFIYQNIQIQNNLIHNAFKNKVKSLIFLGSSCIYPKNYSSNLKEEDLLNGKLEETNKAYAVAKIAGAQMCVSYNAQYNTNFKCLMPCNMFGPNDNYDLENSHFIPALIRKIAETSLNKKKVVHLWGDGTPKRELMYVNDLAEAIIFFMNRKTKETIINIGSGYEKTIKHYAIMIKNKINKKILIKFDENKSLNGTMNKKLNSNLAKKYGWKPKYSVDKSIFLTIKEFLKSNKK
jgi:GDP-L-fucose synthase